MRLLGLALGLLVLITALALCSRLYLRGRLRPLPAAVAARLPQKLPSGEERLVIISKAERVLALYVRGELKASYPVALGGSPEGHKTREGDGRTPEGRYYVCTRHDSRFRLFLGISYPSTSDAQAGLRAGLVTKQQYQQIAAADSARSQPPWNTPLGGEIGIHGGGNGYDWTAGCIALQNDAIDKLCAAVKMGDPVLIVRDLADIGADPTEGKAKPQKKSGRQ